MKKIRQFAFFLIRCYNLKGLKNIKAGDTIMQTIISTTISTITGLIIGFIVSSAKKMCNNNEVQNKALKNLLKSSMVNQHYIYYKIGRAPRKVKETWYDMYESYVELGGNSFIKDDIKPKWDKLESTDD